MTSRPTNVEQFQAMAQKNGVDPETLSELADVLRFDLANTPACDAAAAGASAYFLPEMRFGHHAPKSANPFLKLGDGLGVARVEQGMAAALPLDRVWIVDAELSECSLVLGRSKTHLLAAHLSFSALDQAIGAFEIFEEAGAAVTAVVASVGPAQESRDRANGGLSGPLLRRLEDWTRCGVPASRVVPFSYSYGQEPEDRMAAHPIATADLLIQRRRQWEMNGRNGPFLSASLHPLAAHDPAAPVIHHARRAAQLLADRLGERQGAGRLSPTLAEQAGFMLRRHNLGIPAAGGAKWTPRSAVERRHGALTR